MRTTWFALSGCLTLAAVLAAQKALADPTPVSVWKHDFAAAEAEAKALNRPLVVHFHATWCGPCKKMEREALHSAAALQMLESGLVAVKVDLDQNRKLKEKYAVNNLPTDMIISPSGKILSRTEGYDAGGQQKYQANLFRINAQYAAEVKRLASSNVVADNKNSSDHRESRTIAKNDRAKNDRALASTVPTTKDKLPPPSNKVDPPAGSHGDEPTRPDEPRDVPVKTDFEEIQM